MLDSYLVFGRHGEDREIHSWEIGWYGQESLLKTMARNIC